MHCVLIALALLAFSSAQTQLYKLLPTYGSQNADGSFRVRFFGIAYQRDDTSDDNHLDFFIDDDIIEELQEQASTQEEKDRLAANLDPIFHWDFTDDVTATFIVSPANISVRMTSKTGNSGLIDQFLSFSNDQLVLGQQYQYRVNTNDAANFTIYGPTGYHILCDLDDVIRNTVFWIPETGLENTFLLPFDPVEGMPELFWQWAENLTDVGFHYATTTPIPVADLYINWLHTVYPVGSLDMRPMDITDPIAIYKTRRDQLDRFGATFPKRQLILVADTSANDAITAWPEWARAHPNQYACIFIRNLTYTYDYFYNPLVNLESAFEGVPRAKWFVFDTPEDLASIDIMGGKCKPPGIPDNQTTKSGGYGGTRGSATAATASVASFMMLGLLIVLM